MIKAITFLEKSVTAENDAAVYDAVGADDRVVKGCALSNTADSISINGGYFFVHGRQIQIIGSESIAVEAAPATVPSYFVFEIDMDNETQELKVITTTPVHDDITSGNGVYQMVFATFDNTLSGIANFTDIVGRGNYASIAYQNIQVEVSAWEADATYADYPYKADISLSEITKDYAATVVFSPEETIDYAPVCETLNGAVRIYASDIPEDTLVIPTISAVYSKVVE